MVRGKLVAVSAPARGRVGAPACGRVGAPAYGGVGMTLLLQLTC